ncbi:hypothetical protein [Cohaesibacter gelatinilyticus]|uniref:Uncharacterized protein n=1 Tax=Cohaesibacter gelatinilyticus TaxID=372072 RepID=A0A285PCU1_9HYPH|nr:hypothetical protein [Cohaesibacter gelatinilyticus]SNZ19575.1 hypothetical protein SAMN06265368_2665 [Cohaesibacter gelatinilyticus]
MASRILVGRLLMAFGIIAGFVSFWYTLEYTWTPEFQATNLPEGPTHSNYHAFREAMLAFAVNLLLIWVAIKGTNITRETWLITTFMAIFYYLGWWAAWPIWGYHAPNMIAETNHLIGTIGGMGGLLLLRWREST